MNKKPLQINTAYFDEDSNSIFKDSLQNSSNKSQVILDNQNILAKEYPQQYQNFYPNSCQNNQQKSILLQNFATNHNKSFYKFKNTQNNQDNFFYSFQSNRLQQKNDIQKSNNLRYLSKKKNLIKEMNLIDKQIPLVYTNFFSDDLQTKINEHRKKLDHYKKKVSRHDLIENYWKGIKNYEEQKQVKSKRCRIYADILQKLGKLNEQKQNKSKQQQSKREINKKNDAKYSMNSKINELRQDLIRYKEQNKNFLQNQIENDTNELIQTQEKQLKEQIIQDQQDLTEEQMRKSQYKQIMLQNIKKQLQSLKLEVKEMNKLNFTEQQNLQAKTSPLIWKVDQFKKQETQNRNQKTYQYSLNVPSPYKNNVSTQKIYFQPQNQIREAFVKKNMSNIYQTTDNIKNQEFLNQFPHVKVNNQQIRTFKIPSYDQKKNIKIHQQKEQDSYYPYLKKKILLQLQQA